MKSDTHSTLPVRGLMLDAARLPEPLPLYKRFIDFCAAWNVNTVMFRLTDDQGCAVRFSGHPELLTHEYALTPDEVRSLVSHARNKNIDIIPEVESFGHCRYITGAPEYAHLSDKDSEDRNWREGLIPTHPEVMELLGDLYEETAGLFPGMYLHGGCDEVTWGASDFSRNLLSSSSRTDVWAQHLNGLNRIARDLGRDFIVWADMVCRKLPGCMDKMDRTIILHDWVYREQDPENLKKTAQEIIDRGFRVLGGPAVIWVRWGPRAGESQLGNIDAFCEAYQSIRSKKIMGIITTNWFPSRFLPCADLDGQAYAAAAMSGGVQTARSSAFERFATRHLGADWDEEWADIFRTLYDTAPLRPPHTRQGSGPLLPEVWTDEQSFIHAPGPEQISLLPFGRLAERMQSKSAEVTANTDDFRAVITSVQYLAHIQWRQKVTAELLAGQAGDPHTVMQEIARKDASLTEKILDIWNSARNPWTDSQSAETGHDNIAGTMCGASSFSKKLSENPDMFRRIIGKNAHE